MGEGLPKGECHSTYCNSFLVEVKNGHKEIFGSLPGMLLLAGDLSFIGNQSCAICYPVMSTICAPGVE